MLDLIHINDIRCCEEIKHRFDTNRRVEETENTDLLTYAHIGGLESSQRHSNLNVGKVMNTGDTMIIIKSES